MTMRITMTQARMGQAGTVLAAGSTNTVTREFGTAMVKAGFATDTDGVMVLPQRLTEQVEAQIPALVSGAGILSTPVVLFGDSITDVCRGERLTGEVEPYTGNGYWVWANAALNWRHWRAINAGVSGNTIAQMLGRISTDVLAYSPRVVVVHGGINNVLAVSTDGAKVAALAAMQSGMTQIISAIQATGAVIVLTTLGPLGSNNAPSAAQFWVRARFNQWARQVARNTNGILLCDWDAVLCDPALTGAPIGQSDGGPLVLSDNFVHPSAAGACLMGKALAAVLRELQNSQRQIPYGKSPANYATNPTLVGASGAATHPTGWLFGSVSGVASTVAYSYASRTDGYNGQALVVATAGGAGTPQIQYQHVISLGGDLAVGSVVRFALELEASYAGASPSIAGVSLEAMNASFSSLSRTDVLRNAAINSGGATHIVASGVTLPSAMTLVTPPLALPALTASILVTVSLFGACTWTLKHAAIFDNNY